MNIRPLRSNVLLVILGNNYITLILFFITLFDMSLSSLLGILSINSSYGIPFCEIRSYLVIVGAASGSFASLIQALFRLFRILFFQKRALRSFLTFSIIIIFKWIFVFLINLIYVRSNQFEYIQSEYHCGIALNNLGGTIAVLAIAYAIPINAIFLIYFHIIRYIRRTTHAIQTRKNTNKRDLLVFKRIIILFMILQILSTPLIVVWILYLITKYTADWSYYFQTTILSIGQVVLSVVLASTTPHIRKMLRFGRRQVHPSLGIRVQQHNLHESNNHHEREEI